MKEFEEFNSRVFSEILPTKELKVSVYDKPWMTHQLKILKRKRQRTYQKEGKTEKFQEISKLFQEKKKKGIETYKEKLNQRLKDGLMQSVYRSL